MNRKQIVSISLFVIAIVVLALIPVVTEKDSTINLFILVLLYISISSSWNILGGYTGQTNLGHAAFFGIGSLTTRLLWIDGFPLFPSLLAGGVVAVALALLIGIPAFKLRGVYFAIGTLALAQILNITVGNILPEMSYNPALSDYQLVPRYYLFLSLAILTIGSAYFLVNSRWGLGMMAVREGEDAAESLGISALQHKLLALSVSAFFAGLVGGAFAYYHVSYYLNMPFSPEWTFDPMMMAYIGGQGTIIGPIIGSVFFVGLKQLLVWNVGEYHLIIFGTLFILIVLFLPGGLLEAWEKIKKSLPRWFKPGNHRHSK
ncbi:MAG: branched-chain amino acid ABC transporter permease [Deltaproteobacteria bacterium]|nr:MAG: branched-chain amino acid ABC transporter permease [Deltaproteobacteria bacterium]